MKNRLKGISYAALSSATFGLAPFFTVSLLHAGLSPWEVLTYRWGTASVALALFGFMAGLRFRVSGRNIGKIFLLSLLRAATSLSLVIAYSNIATGVASTIHFMYPLAVAATMGIFFRERIPAKVIAAIAISIVGATMLSSGDITAAGGNPTIGIAAACISVFSYGGYIVGVRKAGLDDVDSATLTLCVMAFGAAMFFVAGSFTTGVRFVTDPHLWLYILGIGIFATAVSNMSLVKAIKRIGPTLTSILGAMEPLTAVVLGILFFGEKFTVTSAIGIVLVIAAVTIAVVHTTPKEKA